MTSILLHQQGRFVASPIARGNLTEDLRGFFAEALAEDGQPVSGDEHGVLTQLAQSLIVNVLDAHLDASYWQGRADGYKEHHGAVSEGAASIDDNNTQGASE